MADTEVVDIFSREPYQSVNEDQTASLDNTDPLEGLQRGKSTIKYAGTPVSMDELYPEPELRSPDLRSAMPLLSEAQKQLTSALESLRVSEIVQSDNYVQHTIALLPELFCCRSLGDGFGMLLSAIFHGLKNKQGEPLTEEEILLVSTVISRLLKEPFIDTDAASDLAMTLEDSNLDIDPSDMKYLSDFLE